MTRMKRISVAAAKAHFSEVVEDARRGKKIMILRHGKPAAAVVPASMVEPIRARGSSPTMTHEEALEVFEGFARLGDPAFDAAADLKAGRR